MTGIIGKTFIISMNKWSLFAHALNAAYSERINSNCSNCRRRYCHGHIKNLLTHVIKNFPWDLL